MAFVAEFLPSLQGIAAARLQVFSACRAYGFGLTGQPTEKSEQRYNACEISGEYSDSNTGCAPGGCISAAGSGGGRLQLNAQQYRGAQCWPEGKSSGVGHKSLGTC